MINSLDKYNSFVFDCDGVVLNSNSIKTNAFYDTALPMGQEIANELKRYHLRHGGISRYEKFSHLLKNIAPKYNKASVPSIEHLLYTYSSIVEKALLDCEIAKHLALLRERTKKSSWTIVSGSDQLELRKIFNERNIDKLFDGGIFGSPDNKHRILARELKNRSILKPALMLGDSLYDYEAASKAGLDFIFVYNGQKLINGRVL
ncbi:HAD family hydrolase [Parasynechococcus marenigrum]|uniref:Possible haloacid dehalogenase-like hydrolase family protein n=1 Tax=Parasynechococcus marenigrum (strain WH8102) TaxID=84588 RepID=Q7U933_PARMW|nr:HAD family hydrolase [Parasynechococcus marenigrum]CAE06941.1 Possible haloacid dehalogenase-like hydrolase family protein [Parasynechococcus marenigrum WH 8102]